MERLGNILERFGYSPRETENPETYPLHDFCLTCKRQKKVFNSYCPGIPKGHVFTFGACNRAKKVARKRWECEKGYGAG